MHSKINARSKSTDGVASFIFRCPCLTMILSLILVLFFLMIMSGTGLKVTLAPNTWYDTSNINTLEQFGFQAGYDQWAEMMTASSVSAAAADADSGNTTRTQTLDRLFLIFESEDGATLLEKSKLEFMKKVQDDFFATTDFPDWCRLDAEGDGSCFGYTSLFDNSAAGSFFDADGNIKPEAEWDSIISSTWCSDASTKTALSITMVDKDFSCDNSADPFKVTYFKSFLDFGGPLEGYESVQRDVAEQHRELGNGYISIVAAPIFKKDQKTANDKGINLYFGGLNPVGGVAYGTVLSYLMADMMLATGSMFFVFLYLLFSLRSLFLSAIGFFEIIVSIPMSFAIFAILGNSYVSFLQFMGLFIIMGIGADDIFVFMDAYTQSMREMHIEDDEEKFLNCYSRSAQAMLVTSCTSGIAFFATAISPIPAVSAFGITMGFMVFCDFFLVITWFPAGVLIYEKYLKYFFNPEGKRKITAEETIANTMKPKLGKVETWFNEKFMGWQEKEAFGKNLIYFFVALIFVCFGVAASSLKVTGDLPAKFSDEHPFTKFRELSTAAFESSGGIPKREVSIFFGVDAKDPVNRDGLDPQGDTLANYANWDADHALTSHEVQSAISELCTSVAADSDLVFNNEVYCFVDDFKAYLTNRGLSWADETHGELILSPGFMDYQRLLFVQRYATGGQKTGVVVDGHSLNTTTLGYELNTGGAGDLNAFSYITFNSTLPLKTNELSLGEMAEVWGKWQDHIDTHNAAHPNAKGLQFCLIWYFMRAGEAIVSTTLVGVTISLVFAAIVLVVANANYIIAGLALLTILAVIACVSMMMVILGWSIDFLGSVCLIVVIGLAVDYTVHFCHSYTHSPEESQFSRTKQAAREMGVSIVSGAVTSFGASIFLLPTALTFFRQFGTFMCATIVFSLILSIFFFLSLTTHYGPERRADGNISGGDIACLKKKHNKISVGVK
ncbi:hypothetical protein TL16_g04949 [Triparma laevis f. inornata]|uniref:SSD domain-containing protein n=1 Tax=Triparma laevis f. inornata TaxID=1714386 RepID=A0A9W7AD99_9STRA|nr:hypothetical protein TL16_g04949 [Triparma laevis f. inornata]